MTYAEALRDVCKRFCVPGQHDPACKELHSLAEGGPLKCDDEHWLLFDAWRIVGCHCGFKADVEADCGRGDSVVAHLLEVPRP